MDAQGIDALPAVRATLSYLKPTAAKPHIYLCGPPPGIPLSSGEIDAIADVPIRDARPLIDQLSLDVQGFVLLRHRARAMR